MKGRNGMELKKYVITGASSGLGLALSRVLSLRYNKEVVGVDIKSPPEGLGMASYVLCDLRDADEVAGTARGLNRAGVDVLVNCAGLNLLNWLEDITVEDYDAVMAVNARAPFLMVKGLLPSLIARKGTVCNIVSNAAHKPMTASLAYNASKGALHIMTLQMAHELTRRWGITVFGLAPHKLEGTRMSQYIEERVVVVRGMTPEAARKYQLGVMPTGRESTPEEVAEFLGWILAEKGRHEQMAGTILPWGA